MLSGDQYRSFFYDGFVVLPNIVPNKLCLDAIRAINQNIGQGMSLEETKRAQSGSWCPSLVSKPVISDLYNKTDLLRIVASFFGVSVPLYGGQIALRFPGALCTDSNSFKPVPYWNKIWHVDGFHSPDNGIPKGEIHNFTMLIGIVLSDVVEEMTGNLVVFPGSHHIVENYMNKPGVIENIKEKGVEGLPGMPLPPAKQIIAKSGSIILAHYSLAHSIAPNTSPFIRYAVYFRVNLRKSQDLIPLKNIWVDYKGLTMEKIVNQERSKIKMPDNSTEIVKSGYVDAKYRENILLFMKRESELNVLLSKGDTLFNAHKWDLALPYFLELVQEKSDDWIILLKVSVCLTASALETNVPKAHPYLKKLIEGYPSLPNGYSFMAQNLSRLKMYKEALGYVDQMLACPPALDQADSVFDALKCAQVCIIQLNVDHVNVMKKYNDTVCNLYPSLRAKVESLGGEQNIQMLWKKGQDFLQTLGRGPIWKDGVKIFGDIVNLNANDYWANVLLGACLTWDGNAKDGEKFSRSAIELNPNMPHGYSGLCQNLQMQGRKNDCCEILKKMVLVRFAEVETNNDHEEKINDAVKVAKNVMDLSDFKKFLSTLRQTYKIKSLDIY
jgi:tetratricopeptide (TPR) repeat protein